MACCNAAFRSNSLHPNYDSKVRSRAVAWAVGSRHLDSAVPAWGSLHAVETLILAGPASRCELQRNQFDLLLVLKGYFVSAASANPRVLIIMTAESPAQANHGLAFFG